MRGLKVRGAGRRPVTAGGAREGARLTRLEVGDEPDGRAPPVSPWCKKEKGEGAVLCRRVAELGQLGRRARVKKRKGLWPGCLRAEGLLGRREKRKREGEGKRVFLFLLNFLFKFIFQTFKLQSNKIHAFES
jgi:hypothetical protein